MFQQFKLIQDATNRARNSAAHISDRLAPQEDQRQQAGRILAIIENLMQFATPGLESPIFAIPTEESCKAISDLQHLCGSFGAIELDDENGEQRDSEGGKGLIQAQKAVQAKYSNLQRQLLDDFSVAFRNLTDPHAMGKLKQQAFLMMTYFDERHCIHHFLKYRQPQPHCKRALLTPTPSLQVQLLAL